MQITKTLAGAFGLLLLPSLAYGAGFQLNEHGAPATGRAGAAIASVRDPSAVYHNTAAILRLEGTQMMLGASIIVPSGGYTGRGFASTNPSGEIREEKVKSQAIPVPYLFATHRLTEDLAVGLGVYNHYGLGVHWDDEDNFSGRTIMQELSLRTFYITPSVAYKFGDRIRVGVALNLVPGSLYIRRVLGAADTGQLLFGPPNYQKEGRVEISATAFGMGGIAALQFKLREDFWVGFSYKSAVKMSFTGDAHFDLPADLPESIRKNFPDQDGSGKVTLPHTLGLGLAFERGSLTVEGVAQLTTWSTYEELRIKFGAGLPQKESVAPRNWKSTPQFRLGGEYRATDKLSFRLGGALDFTPAPADTVDPTMPDSSRVFGTAGFGYDFGMFALDVGYLALYTLEREVTEADKPKNFAPGTYGGGWVHILSIGLSLHI